MIAVCEWYRCLSSQRYNFLKANHNSDRLAVVEKSVVYQVKDTIFWKQITTVNVLSEVWKLLFIKSKIQFFESKSQLTYAIPFAINSCLSSQRYNFLKANHNRTQEYHCFVTVVYQVKDTIFWKQITTRLVISVRVWMLFIKSKIQFFESKSQP